MVENEEKTITNDDSPIELLTDDGKVTKRIIQAGFGRKPNKFSTVIIHFESFLSKTGIKFDSSLDRDQEFSFDLSTDKVIKGWEIALPTMKIGEVAEIVCSYSYAYGEDGCPPMIPPKAKVRTKVELLSVFDQVNTAQEKLEAAKAKKEEGTDLLKQGQITLARYAYLAGRRYVIELWDCSPAQLYEARELTIALQLNIAACNMKLHVWDNAIESLKYVLDRDPHNVKAFYRLGQVYMDQLEYEKGIEIVQQGLQAVPGDANLINILKTLEQKSKLSLKSSTQIYRNMFK